MLENLNERLLLQRQSSMLFWWPLINDLPIPMPETKIMKLTNEDIAQTYSWIDNGKAPQELLERVRKVASTFTYPLFIKTDMMADKHSWGKSCFVESEDKLIRNLFRLLESNQMVDFGLMPYKAIVFRNFIKMRSLFKAFLDMPVNHERRYFIKDGEVQCHHPYWPIDSIKFYGRTPPKHWVTHLQRMNLETPEEIEHLSQYTRMVANRVKGYWSVDFCLGEAGHWYMIDLARGEISYHPPCRVLHTEESIYPLNKTESRGDAST